MAWYPGARKLELQPESDAQPAIRPTQFIVHSVVAPWDEQRIYEYWRDSTALESHFGLDYDGSLGQFIGTETRADANAGANRRADGTGAVSIETASNTKASDPWTPEQIEQLIRLGVWLHQKHGIPLRICRTQSDPGFGYHSLFPQWSTSGTACPGAARIRQFKTVVFPGIVARSAGQPPKEDGMTLSTDDVKKIAKTDDVFASPDGDNDAGGNTHWTLESYQRYGYLQDRETNQLVKQLAAQAPIELTDAQVQAIADKVAAAPGLADAIASKVAELIAARLAE